MGKGGAGKQHIQATTAHVEELRGILSEIRDSASSSDGRRSKEAELLDYYWWLASSDTTLRRFITANNCDVPAAQAQLLSHLEWRGPYGVDTITEEVRVRSHTPHNGMTDMLWVMLIYF